MTKKMRRVEGPLARERRRRTRAWTVAGLSVTAFALAGLAVGRGDATHTHHPGPRAASERTTVVPTARYASYPRVAETYEMAAAVPMILDGLHCFCECDEHSGHYSLLDCFNSDHAARCDVCMSEAVIAYRMHHDGASLDAIRAEVDRTYGT
jgi:hypothetical protein